MQGTVIKVAVTEGQQVEAGDLVLVLEAMKMEQPVNAHKAGTIAKLSVEPGSSLANGALICEIKALVQELGRADRPSSASVWVSIFWLTPTSGASARERRRRRPDVAQARLRRTDAIARSDIAAAEVARFPRATAASAGLQGEESQNQRIERSRASRFRRRRSAIVRDKWWGFSGQ